MITLSLLAGGGFTISRMICGSTGDTSYELGQMKSCSGEEQNGQCFEGTCCKMSSSQLDQNSHTVTPKPEPPQQDLQVVAIPFLSPLSVDKEVSSETEPSGFDPPNIGFLVLRLITVLLI